MSNRMLTGDHMNDLMQNSQVTVVKRGWRPRFSLQALALGLTLLALPFGYECFDWTTKVDGPIHLRTPLWLAANVSPRAGWRALPYSVGFVLARTARQCGGYVFPYCSRYRCLELRSRPSPGHSKSPRTASQIMTLAGPRILYTGGGCKKRSMRG